MKKVIIALLLFASCTHAKKKLKVSTPLIQLGDVTVGDTVEYKFGLQNLSAKDSIHIKGISSNCTCAVVELDVFVIPPLFTKEVRGKYISKSDDIGNISQRIAIHSDADSTFQFVTIQANVN